MHIVILGNGISGITAARFLRKLSDHQVTVISAETDYFFSRTALMYVYMGHMPFEATQPYEDWFWTKNRIKLIRGYVNAIDFDQKTLHFDTSIDMDTTFDPPPTMLSYDRLVLALGSTPNVFDWTGTELKGVNGLYSLQDLAYLEKASESIKQAVIVGGGLIGIELAEMLKTRGKQVTMLVREKSYWRSVLPEQESQMINRHLSEHGVNVKWETELEGILGDENGRCRGVRTKANEEIECDFVGLTAGVHPNVEWLKDGPLEIDRGILVDDRLRTNLPDVYAIGDCAQVRTPKEGRKSIEAVWYVGRIMGETLGYILTGHAINYHPGLWYNSAKFFDIEYQVYGHVSAGKEAHINSLYWECETGRKAVRINYEYRSTFVIGINVMGIRLRQEVCLRWIENQYTIEQVLVEFGQAHFDPEFYRTYQNDLNRLYSAQLQKRNTDEWA